MSMSVPLIFAEQDVEGGGKEEKQGGIQNDICYKNNVHSADVKIRMAFLRKVYGLLSVQLLITVIISAVFMMCEPVKLFVQQNTWMLGVSIVMSIITIFVLIWKGKEHPTNLILLTAFTLFESHLIGTVVTMFDTNLVLEALFITLFIVTGLTAYTFQTKKDFSFMGFGLFAGLSALMVGGLIQIFVQSTVLEVGMSIGGALLFSLFIIFDTKLLMNTLSPEEYIIAVVNIYLDILNLFLYILRILTATRN
ncbi:protein lifeguard 4 [Orussus abietinus]|uniref:protein lifeguard 4 n=1 Tax=Orussus abietinus TaxID=222816 RepID=UPI000624FE94|nr:protein lifeguard 4 [Orussus abietinus]XP_012288891.1 protein lifeguard 4 [Orussus abietinus]